MTVKRKVREDFDLTKEYSVDVLQCTVGEKKEVQQAFFDVGILWKSGGKEYRYLDALQYSNTTYGGGVTTDLMHGITTKGCNMTAKEFLALVYEPDSQGHIHAELMAQYAEDAKTLTEPWKLWQVTGAYGIWYTLEDNPTWCSSLKYRRKPKTHIVNGVEIPDLRFTPESNETYYYPAPHLPALVQKGTYLQSYAPDAHRNEHDLCYKDSEEGKQAAILHTKAMMGLFSCKHQLSKANWLILYLILYLTTKKG